MWLVSCSEKSANIRATPCKLQAGNHLTCHFACQTGWQTSSGSRNGYPKMLASTSATQKWVPKSGGRSPARLLGELKNITNGARASPACQHLWVPQPVRQAKRGKLSAFPASNFQGIPVNGTSAKVHDISDVLDDNLDACTIDIL